MNPLLCAVVFALVATSHGQTCDGDPIDAAVYQNLLSELHSIPNSIVRHEYFTKWVSNSTNTNGQGFNGDQVLGIVKSFDNTFDKVEVVQEMEGKTLGMKCSQVIDIMKQSFSSFHQIDLLKALVNDTTDLPTQNQTLVDFFTNFFDKQDARKIIAASSPTDCVWGDISLVKRVYLIMDTSGSMGDLVNTKRWGTISKLDYAVKSLQHTLASNLRPSQEFNLVSFSDYAHAWQPGLQAVNPSTRASAEQWAGNLYAQGSTNAIAAFRLAFQDPKCTGIFFLTDGLPSGPTSTIIQSAVAWSKSVPGGGKVFPIGFYSSAYWLTQLAKETGGTYRNIHD